MTIPPLTEKLVYLTLRGIFVGEHSQLRKAKAIRAIIIKNHTNAKIRAFTLNYDINTISTMAKALLKDQVFASDAIAKLRFPDAFEGLSTQPTQPITSGSENAASSTAAVQPTVSEPKNPSSSAVPLQRVGVYSPEELLGIGERLTLMKEEEKFKTTKSQLESFNSISLPLWDQHRILVRVQYTLEKACFSFVQERLSELLQIEEWDCAEAVELNQWARTLLIHRQALNLDDVKDIAKPLPMLLESITQLRHNAVHRVRLLSSNLLEHLADAGLLAQLLQDDGCSKLISLIRQRTQDAIEKLLRNKQMLDCKLAEIKKEFAAKRAELERQEAALLEAAVREHREPVISVSGSLDRLSDDPGDSDGFHAPWRRVYDDALPNDESSGSESVGQSTRGGEPKDDTPEAMEEEVEIANPPPVPVPTQPVDDALVNPAMLREQEEVDKDKDQALSVAEPSLSHVQSELDCHESEVKQSSEDPSVNQQELETDTKNAAEEFETESETAAAFEAKDSDPEEYDEEPRCEPSNSSTSTAVEDTEDDAAQIPHQSPIEDDPPIRIDTPIEDDPPVENVHMSLEEIIKDPIATANIAIPSPPPPPPPTHATDTCEKLTNTLSLLDYDALINAIMQNLADNYGSEDIVSRVDIAKSIARKLG